VASVPIIHPMLLSYGKLPSGREWVYEPKWDGFGAVAYCSENGVRFRLPQYGERATTVRTVRGEKGLEQPGHHGLSVTIHAMGPTVVVTDLFK
jgi:hypothetical protein